VAATAHARCGRGAGDGTDGHLRFSWFAIDSSPQPPSVACGALLQRDPRVHIRVIPPPVGPALLSPTCRFECVRQAPQKLGSDRSETVIGEEESATAR
jgi:hypothetical protein